MKTWLKYPLRVAARLLWLGGEISLAPFTFMGICAFRSKTNRMGPRALWLHYTCRRCLKVFGVKSFVSGPIPSHGLLVCNHLSYLDVLVVAAQTPAVFVAKREVKSWPVFGWFARLAGTLFVHREKRTQVAQATAELEASLDSGALVVLFPEGTSSDGQTVLPFKSALLAPSTRRSEPLFTGFIRYELDDGDAREEICYWKNMTLLPHMINLLSKRAPRVFVRFSQSQHFSKDRKELARQLHSEFLRLQRLESAGTPHTHGSNPGVLALEPVGRRVLRT
jgi:1-acyl-sn-glycerol-3-phosphate acyltransferase